MDIPSWVEKPWNRRVILFTTTMSLIHQKRTNIFQVQEETNTLIGMDYAFALWTAPQMTRVLWLVHKASNDQLWYGLNLAVLPRVAFNIQSNFQRRGHCVLSREEDLPLHGTDPPQDQNQVHPHNSWSLRRSPWSKAPRWPTTPLLVLPESGLCSSQVEANSPGPTVSWNEIRCQGPVQDLDVIISLRIQ